ncbi:lysozyme inhibitor LprI family protein [Paraburkholderia sp. BL21I4N1]|uniref:lysozyme inhibitor LprI family protein n=1 Tax=Paraburkholderia sp. BL21I4N1 TaxID=1938801 RepID=UPI0015E3C341|nr:lysozyme inhibitor LprI family protein [Paraburkholderia sp. BL21I4N1]
MSAVQAQECKPNDVSDPCVEQATQREFERADRDLNATYSQVVRKISVPKNEYVDYPALKAKLAEAQRQWVRFRDSECDAWYKVSEAGTGRNAFQSNCLTQRTVDRTRELKAWLEYLP